MEICRIDKILTLTKRQEFLVKLAKLKIKKTQKIMFSDIERALNFKNPQPDLREILKELVDLKILIFDSKDRHGYNIYVLDNKKLLEFIFNSDLSREIQDVIFLVNPLAVIPN